MYSLFANVDPNLYFLQCLGSLTDYAVTSVTRHRTIAIWTTLPIAIYSIHLLYPLTVALNHSLCFISYINLQYCPRVIRRLINHNLSLHKLCAWSIVLHTGKQNLKLLCGLISNLHFIEKILILALISHLAIIIFQ